MTVQQKDNLNLRELQQQLQQALILIQQNNISKNPILADDVQGLWNTQSLLQRCEQVVQQGQDNQKPLLRIIHHFACSGGTLISKCIAAQPNVYLLSELHPFTTLHLGNGKAKFLPTDIIGQAKYANVPDADVLAADIFVENVIKAEKHLRERGGRLVIRVHSHSDYCVGDTTEAKETLNRLLSDLFDIQQLVTVRDPVDSYSSLVQNNWVHFTPGTFDEYCRRLLVFLSQFKPEQIFSYEAFTHAPQEQIQLMLRQLKLPINPNFDDYFEIFNVSGDSGRSGNTIAPRERRPLSPEYALEVESSVNYKLFKKSPYNLNGV